MDTVFHAFTEADQRRLRMGALTNAVRGKAWRAGRPDETLSSVAPEAEAHDSEGETPSQVSARIEREKAEWKNGEQRRQAFDAMLRENLGQTRKLAAQNGIPELTALYQAQREMRRVEAEKNEANAEVQANLSASNAQIQSLMSAARDGSASWEYRRSVLGRARLAVADHLVALHQVQDRIHDKFAEFAGKPELVSELGGQATEVDQRKRVMEEYYGVLESLVGGGGDEADLDRLGSTTAAVAPEVVRNSSTMRLMARRRRNFWAEVA